MSFFLGALVEIPCWSTPFLINKVSLTFQTMSPLTFSPNAGFPFLCFLVGETVAPPPSLLDLWVQQFPVRARASTLGTMRTYPGPTR
jgi:hypothetical protein